MILWGLETPALKLQWKAEDANRVLRQKSGARGQLHLFYIAVLRQQLLQFPQPLLGTRKVQSSELMGSSGDGKGVARGSCGARDPPFCKPLLTKPTTSETCHIKPKHGVEVDMTIWWVPSLWHNVIPPPFEKSWLRPWMVNQKVKWYHNIAFMCSFNHGQISLGHLRLFQSNANSSDFRSLPPPLHSMLGINWSTFSPAHYFPPSNIEWGGRGLQKYPEFVIKSDLKYKTPYCPYEFVHDCLNKGFL